ncbi:MAG: polysaccharide biosynthesis protein [Deltaproteobacteria bacterium]|nr:polysaccharide biosynthesis protein [Deltaproteobacteria bacterium]
MRDKISTALEGKHMLVTGGTGSFGHAIVKELARFQPASISIFSRDEKKQYEMQHEFSHECRLRFFLGDVRDFERTREVMRGIDIVFHAAALKQVPNCEFAPFEAVRTNIVGAENLRRAAVEAGVKTVIAISTDKAVKPVNVMGMSKAIQERIMLNPTNESESTKFVCVRYGNVMGSRGSVVPLFCDYILKGEALPITHPDMTRFQLTLQEAVHLVLWATVRGESGDLWVRKMPATTIRTLGRVLAYGMTGNEEYPERIVGTRPGEKMHEVLVSEEEMWRATELEDHFLIPSWAKSQDTPGITEGAFKEYSSEDVHQLSEGELLEMLMADGWITPEHRPGPKARLSHG